MKLIPYGDRYEIVRYFQLEENDNLVLKRVERGEKSRGEKVFVKWYRDVWDDQPIQDKVLEEALEEAYQRDHTGEK